MIRALTRTVSRNSTTQRDVTRRGSGLDHGEDAATITHARNRGPSGPGPPAPATAR